MIVKQLLFSLFLTFFCGLALDPASYAVDGCSSPRFKVATTMNLEAASAFAAAKFEVKNASKTYDVLIEVERCENKICEGKVVFTLFKKDARDLSHWADVQVSFEERFFIRQNIQVELVGGLVSILVPVFASVANR